MLVTALATEMMRRSATFLLGMHFGRTAQDETSSKKSWTELFWKPKTRDEAIKDYVPEVLEESLSEQRAVLAQQTTRDAIVEHGHKILREIENKAPTPSIFPALNKILALYGPDHIISQRALNLLLYPGSAPQFQQTQAPELIANFGDHFKAFIEVIEQNGSYHHDVKLLAQAKVSQTPSENQTEGEGDAKPAEIPKPVAEPQDITYLVKCVAGMTLANIQIGDNANALKCCDAALGHVIDDGRKGGVLALKAGVLIKLKRYGEAADAARLSIAASPSNPQAYLQGAAALRLMGKNDEAIALLTDGIAVCPGNEAVQTMLDTTTRVRDAEALRLANGEPAAQVEAGTRRKRTPRLQLAQ
jgi:tetratricopeptide (TPR) repeat protein